MATIAGNNPNGSAEDYSASGAAKQVRATASRAAGVVDDAISAAEDGLDSLTPAGLPERKYSFNALLAAGVAGYFIGRVLSR